MLDLIIAALIGLVVAGGVGGAGFGIIKVSKKARSKKLANTFKKDTQPELLKEAIIKIAKHCGMEHCEEVKALTQFDFNKEELERQRLNQLSVSKQVSDKKIAKISRVK